MIDCRRQNSIANENSTRTRRLPSTSRRMTLSNIHNSEEMNDEDGPEMLAIPEFWTKNFVLLLLFAYMSITAFAFTFTQENWNFLDSFYFCLITLVNCFYYFKLFRFEKISGFFFSIKLP